MVLAALTPAEVADLCGLDGAAAIDAYLITGGMPLITQDWRRRWGAAAVLRAAFSDPTSLLLVSCERILGAELPASVKAHDALVAIGDGERTFSNNATGAGMNQSTLVASLETLVTKRLVAVDAPLSTKASSKDRRFRIADPYLRFWLAFVPGVMPLVERGRADLALARWERSWEAWRGRAVEVPAPTRPRRSSQFPQRRRPSCKGPGRIVGRHRPRRRLAAMIGGPRTSVSWCRSPASRLRSTRAARFGRSRRGVPR